MPEPEEDDESPVSRPFWSGTITFGLVSIPVALYAATRSSRVGLRTLSPDGTPLRRRYYSESTNRDLSDDEIVRGYEIDKGKWITVTDEELERLAPEKSRDIDLRRFVKDSEIPRMQFERGYFLVPSGGSVKAYRLLAETMAKSERAGIATFVMRGKEYLIAILSENGYLRAETLRFSDELRSPEQIGLTERPSVPKKAVRDWEKRIDLHVSDELPREELRNHGAERMLALIGKKQAKGKDVVGHRRKGGEEEPEVVDILALLQQRLGEVAAGAGAKRSARAAAGASKPKTSPRKARHRPR